MTLAQPPHLRHEGPPLYGEVDVVVTGITVPTNEQARLLDGYGPIVLVKRGHARSA